MDRTGAPERPRSLVPGFVTVAVVSVLVALLRWLARRVEREER